MMIKAPIPLLVIGVAFSLLPSTSGFAYNAIEAGKSNLARFKSALPPDFDAVKAGGWNSVYEMNADPKAELVSIIASSLKNTEGSVSKSAASSKKIDTLVGLLESRGKGFTADLVNGEWAIVLSRQGDKSPKFQKAVEKSEKAQKAFSNFDIKQMKFFNENYTKRGNGKLEAVVKYDTSREGITRSADGEIVLRRITCDIVGASFKYWKLPKIPLPLRAKGGSLDFLYLDQDMRVTRGNRGGLFVHFRPDFLEKVLNE